MTDSETKHCSSVRCYERCEHDDAAAWADNWGTDRHGPWATFSIAAASGEAVVQKMRWCPPGAFIMGVQESDKPFYGDYRQRPQTPVEIARGFWLFDTPCTQALWMALMRTNPSEFPDPDRPVGGVTIRDAEEFLTRINEARPGINLSLPSEARWEYACRAGTTTQTYAGPFEDGDQDPRRHHIPVLDPIAWYIGNSGGDFDLPRPRVDGYRGLHPPTPIGFGGTRKVGLKLPNPWGLYDMLGNVWEICPDAWDLPTGEPSDGSVRKIGHSYYELFVMRGGSYRGGAEAVNCASRYCFGDVESWAGFRCARVLGPC